MALLFLDSFDHDTTTARKYLSGSASIVTGRHGNGSSGPMRLALTPGHARCILGAAFKFGTTSNGVYAIYDTGGQVCGVSTQNDGSISVDMWGGPSARTAPDVYRLHQWHYLEVDLTIAVTNLNASYDAYNLTAVKVYLDGLQVLNTTLGTGLAFPIGTASTYRWTHVDILPSASAVIDDVYVLDGSGAAPHNAPLGDVQIDVIRPNGAGAVTQWTPAGAASNWDAVNDAAPDDDATVVTAGSSGLSDLYQMEDVSTGNGVLGAQLLVCAARSNDGFATLTPLLRHAGVTTALTPRAMASGYFYRNRQCFVTMPNGDPLTDSNMNALQAGVRRDA